MLFNNIRTNCVASRMKKPPLGIFASGRGTRLFGPNGGCKALTPIAGKPLIEYVLTEAHGHGVRQVYVVVNPDDVELMAYLDKDIRFEQVTIIQVEASGTMKAVTALIDLLGDNVFFLSTCDMIAPAGVFALLENKLQHALDKGLDPLIVFLASTWFNDNNPIWIEPNHLDIVLRYGKGIPPAPLVFGNMRLCNATLKAAVASVKREGIITDTQLMSAILSSMPGRFIVTEAPDRIFDVDDRSDVTLVEHYLQRREDIPH